MENEENVEYQIEKKADEIGQFDRSLELPECETLESVILEGLLEYDGAFDSMPPEFKKMYVSGNKSITCFLTLRGFYDKWLRILFASNQLLFMYFATQVLETVGRETFNQDSIDLMKELSVKEIVKTDPILTFSYINMLLVKEVISISEFADAEIIKLLEDMIEYVHPSIIISIISSYLEFVTPSEYCDQLTYEKEIETALNIVLHFLEDPEFTSAVISAVSISLNSMSSSITIHIIINQLPKILQILFSSSSINFSNTMNFIIRSCAYSITITKKIIEHRNSIIKCIDRKECRESVLKFIIDLWHYLACYDDSIDACFYCLDILLNNLEDIKMTEHITIISYIEWIIENIEEDFLAFMFSGKINVLKTLSYFIDISECLDDIYVCKSLHIISMIIPSLLANPAFINDIPFDEITEMLKDCSKRKSPYIKERVLFLKAVLN